MSGPVVPSSAGSSVAAEGEVVRWSEDDCSREAGWRSESGASAPKRVIIADDSMKADTAYRLACAGTGILWRGDFNNARQLLQAMGRRTNRKRRNPATSPVDGFNQHRQTIAQRARTLGRLLVPLEQDFTIPLRRAPDVQEACFEAYGPASGPSLVSLRELLGLIGAHEWRRRGVEIPALGERIHPHYGVFSPVRGEYVDLIAQAPLPAQATAFDIGTGTGVLAAVLAQRGVERVVATEHDPRALACARENIQRLELNEQVEVLEADLFPPGRADVVVCNPPWLPARPSSPLDHAVYDHESRMLLGFLAGLPEHLVAGGEGWLVLSDLAEHLGLRSREQLLAGFESAGLKVVARVDIRPRHPKSADRDDPLSAARAAEMTSLWRLSTR